MDNRRKKLLYRATHRGIREMDLVLTAFCASELAGLGETELDEFEALLDVPDQDFFSWITGAGSPPPEHQSALLTRICKATAVVGAPKPGKSP